MTSSRLVLSTALPDAYKQLIALSRTVGQAAEDAGLAKTLIELVKIRASQLNGCAFCLDMHSTDALKYGESTRRLMVLAAWRDTELFTAQERAALALTESMTELSQHQEVPDDVYGEAAKLFSEPQLTALAWAITVINAFNRFGVTSRLPLPKQAS